MYRKTLILLLSFICTLVSVARDNEITSPRQKLVMAERLIETFYADSVDSDKMVEQAIIAMLKQLDPHSTYTDADETKELTTALEGNFSGIGISFNMQNDSLYVISTISGGPSEKAGILPGDRIIAADDSIISGVGRKNSSVMSILRGEKGTKVNITVVRRSEPGTLSFVVVRDDIPVESVAAKYMVNDSIGYIRLSRFAETSDKEVKDAVAAFRKKGMTSLILDLTDNSGGYMKSAIEIAGEFLPKNKIIVTTKANKLGQEAEYAAQKGGGATYMKLVVMVNQYSASASEIVSGALQDYDRAVVVGRRTFGKGLVQRPMPFPDGSMIRLTIARYYTPSGRLIQKPYKEGGEDEYNLDLYDRIKSGEYFSRDSVHFDESKKTKTLVKGRTIYGGGGIMPDIFVPVDTTVNPPVLRKLIATNAVAAYAQDYADINRGRIMGEYPDEDLFISGFEITPEILSGLLKKAEVKDTTITREAFEIDKNVIALYLKALIGRQLYSPNVFYRQIMTLDPIYKKSVEILSDGKYTEVLQNQ